MFKFHLKLFSSSRYIGLGDIQRSVIDSIVNSSMFPQNVASMVISFALSNILM